MLKAELKRPRGWYLALPRAESAGAGTLHRPPASTQLQRSLHNFMQITAAFSNREVKFFFSQESKFVKRLRTGWHL